MSVWSFRGVEFFVEADVLNIGRNYAEHNFPFRDKVSFENLGLQSKRFPINAYVIGDPEHKIGGKSAQDKRDELMRACEAKETGILKHPDLGSINAVNLKCQITREDTVKNVIRFALEFAESEILPPFVQELPKLNTGSFDIGIADVFATEFNIKGWSSMIRNKGISALSGLAKDMNIMRAATSGFNNMTSLMLRSGRKLDALMSSFIDIERNISNLKDGAVDLVNQPQQFAKEFLTIQRSLVSLPKSLGLQGEQTVLEDQKRVNQMLDLATKVELKIFDRFATRSQQNTIAATRLQQMSHVAGALQLASETFIRNKDEAKQLQKGIAKSIDKIMIANSKSLDPKIVPRVLQSLDNTRAETLVLLRQKELDAPQAIQHKPNRTEPLLAACFENQKTYKQALLMNTEFFNPLVAPKDQTLKL